MREIARARVYRSAGAKVTDAGRHSHLNLTSRFICVYYLVFLISDCPNTSKSKCCPHPKSPTKIFTENFESRFVCVCCSVFLISEVTPTPPLPPSLHLHFPPTISKATKLPTSLSFSFVSESGYNPIHSSEIVRTNVHAACMGSPHPLPHYINQSILIRRASNALQTRSYPM